MAHLPIWRVAVLALFVFPFVAIYVFPQQEIAKGETNQQSEPWRDFLIQENRLARYERIHAYLLGSSVMADLSDTDSTWLAEQASYFAFKVALHYDTLNAPDKHHKPRGEKHKAGVEERAPHGKQLIDFLLSDKLENRLLHSDMAFVGEVRSTTDQLLGDGFRSTISIIVERPIKGRINENETVFLRQSSGLLSTGGSVESTAEQELLPGSRYVFFLSNALYRYFVQYPPPTADIVDEDVASQLKSDPNAFRHYAIRSFTDMDPSVLGETDLDSLGQAAQPYFGASILDDDQN